MESPLDRITVDLEVCHGKPCIRGMHCPVETMLEYLSGGDSVETVLGQLSDLEREDLLACIEFARRAMVACGFHLSLA